MSNFFEEWVNESEEHQRLVAEESLILDVTEKIHAKMEALGVSRTELAERMGKSKAYVSQLVTMILFAVYLGRLNGRLSVEDSRDIISELKRLPYMMEKILSGVIMLR